MPYDDEQMEGTPVFLINGFLESGKTQFLRYTLDQPYFQTGEKTLLILCEEGIEEYPRKLLKKTDTTLVTVNDISEVSVEKLEALAEAYYPERVIIEWNGVWPQDQFKMPKGWFLNQQITVIDTSTFDTYLKNMKPLLGQMLRFSELVLCNRADNIPEETLGSYMMSIKAMCPRDCDIIFEGEKGEIRGDFNINLPYDIKSDDLKLEPNMFGYFYIDSMDRPERYDGKSVEYVGQILKPTELGPKYLVVGRRCMTCCADDIQFLGPVCVYEHAESFKTGEWVKVKAQIKAEDFRAYGCVGPVLYATELLHTGAIDDVVQF